MGVDEVVAGLASENVNTPLGRLTLGGTEMPLRISGKPAETAGFASMVIGRRGTQPIRLSDVATIEDTVEEQRSLALVDGEPAVAIDIIKQTKANTVAVVDGVRAAVDELRAELPAGVEIQIVRDTSIFIREAVADVQVTLIIGALLTVFIVFLFLNSWRSTVITGLTLPISVISAFIVMYFLGMTLNMLTLMALSLAIGLLIDDAIVVRENIVRHLEHGRRPLRGGPQGHRRDRPGRAGDVDVDHRGVRAGGLHEGHHRPLLLPVRPHGGVRRPRLAVRVLHPRPDALVAVARPRHPPGRQAQLVAQPLDCFNDWFERMADGYKRVIGWALDHRKTIVAARRGGLRRRPRRVRHARDRVP